MLYLLCMDHASLPSSSLYTPLFAEAIVLEYIEDDSDLSILHVNSQAKKHVLFTKTC